MPFTLALIRKLASAGHEVWAADDYELAPGSHTRYAAGHYVTPSPREDTEAFVTDIERICGEREIDVLVPSFEETFYLATRFDRLSAATSLFMSPFEPLARLHDKASFQELVTRLGLPTPATHVATSDAELAELCESIPRYFARAAFSRGGVSLLTNTGPLAGAVAIGDCHPTPESPWLVQEFVDGPTVCTYSAAHEGEVSAHCMYRIPRQWRHSTGIQFESMDGTESLRIIEKIVAELGYTGHISFDFVDRPDAGLTLIECNPRVTDGVLILGADELAEAILSPRPGQIETVPAGAMIQLDLAVLGDAFADHFKHLPSSVAELSRIHDAGHGWHDPLPNLYSALALAHHERASLSEHQKLFIAMAGDISWDGQPIAGMSAADQAFMAGLERSA